MPLGVSLFLLLGFNAGFPAPLNWNFFLDVFLKLCLSPPGKFKSNIYGPFSFVLVSTKSLGKYLTQTAAPTSGNNGGDSNEHENQNSKVVDCKTKTMS